MKKPLPWISLALGLAAVLVHLSPSLTLLLEYDRAAVAAGEVFRIFTCHWTHWSLDHLFWDTLALVLLGALCERSNRMRFVACLAGSMWLIPVAVMMFCPELVSYRGLSGIDSALFTLLAVTILRQKLRDREWGWALGVGLISVAFAAKILFEITTGTTVFVDSHASEMVPVPLAHVVGGGVGALAGMLQVSSPGASRSASPASLISFQG